MRVYLDSCVLSRLTDEPIQLRIVQEAEAIDQLFRLLSDGVLEWSASTALVAELRKNPDWERRRDALEMLTYAGRLILPDASTFARARELQAAGYGTLDGLHLAFAEQVRADVLLTTDDRFYRLAARNAGVPKVEVANPVEWLRRMKLWRPQTQ